MTHPQALVIDFGTANHGAAAYQSMLMESLVGHFDVRRHALEFAKHPALKIVTAPLRVSRLAGAFFRARHYALVIDTEVSILWPWGRRPPIVAVLHHIGGTENWLYALLEDQLIERLRGVDAVVVPSHFWSLYFRNRGFRNVHTIHNGFRIEEFQFQDEEVENFRRKYCLVGKPIIYLGDYQKLKGGPQAFEVLKHLDVHFVASGTDKADGALVRCLYLERKEYLRLLRSSIIVVTMSQFAEGWCRVAHEAMLCGTPVLGSGNGGMRELLESGRQIICDDFEALKHEVECLLKNDARRAELGQAGAEYGRQFTFERFQAAWLQLARQVCYSVETL